VRPCTALVKIEKMGNSLFSTLVDDFLGCDTVPYILIYTSIDTSIDTVCYTSALTEQAPAGYQQHWVLST